MTGWGAIALAIAVWGLCWMRVESDKATAQLEIAKLHCVAVKP